MAVEHGVNGAPGRDAYIACQPAHE
jgi:hypothetical protein